jgi:hypothetical protein
MKEVVNKLSEKQIALITLALTVVALIIGVALPEIRTALGLEKNTTESPRQANTDKATVQNQNIADINLPKPPPTPGTDKENLPRVEIKKDYENSGAQTGEFIIYPGVTFENTGFLSGKVIIQKGATFKNTGAIEGDILNKGGTFKNTGFLDGALTVE